MFAFNFLFIFSHAQESIPASIYDFKVKAEDGSVIDFAQYKGKKILIVNTPLEGDGNPYYAELENLYKQHSNNLVIIGFLDRDFGVAPGSKKVPDQLHRDYNVSFPLSAMITVRGGNMAPIYKWLTSKKYNKLKDNEVQWDFQKYLINEQGSLVAVFDPELRPADKEIVSAIEK